MKRKIIAGGLLATLFLATVLAGPVTAAPQETLLKKYTLIQSADLTKIGLSGIGAVLGILYLMYLTFGVVLTVILALVGYLKDWIHIW